MQDDCSGQTIALKSHDGGTFGAYMAVPASGSGPGLVVLQGSLSGLDFGSVVAEEK